MATSGASGGALRLYHAPSSYYSMIARLALAEAGLAYDPVYVDIHFRGAQQRPAYARPPTRRANSPNAAAPKRSASWAGSRPTSPMAAK